MAQILSSLSERSRKLERLQLADERRDGAEAAPGEVEVSQRLHLSGLCREHLVLGTVP